MSPTLFHDFYQSARILAFPNKISQKLSFYPETIKISIQRTPLSAIMKTTNKKGQRCKTKEEKRLEFHASISMWIEGEEIGSSRRAAGTLSVERGMWLARHSCLKAHTYTHTPVLFPLHEREVPYSITSERKIELNISPRYSARIFLTVRRSTHTIRPSARNQKVVTWRSFAGPAPLYISALCGRIHAHESTQLAEESVAPREDPLYLALFYHFIMH